MSLLANLALAQPAVVSPEVLPDGRVTFRVQAPKAQAVAVKGLRHLPAQPMAKGDNGVWSVTVGPLAPDLYSYTFEVDGATFTDPVNRRLKEWLNQESVVEVPGKPPLLLSRQDVPHGEIHRHVFPSSVRGTEVAVEVYTPPGFDPKSATTYPVLYLLHGFGDEETAWLVAGRAHFIADNLLAQNRIVPAIVVMTNGHPLPIPPEPRPPEYGPANNAAMEQELLRVVLPFIEAHYPVRQGVSDRAIVGLSMGGAQALTVGLGHPDVFGWVGGFSAGTLPEEWERRFGALLTAEQKKSGAPRLIWIGVGQEDSLVARNTKFHAWLQEKLVPHEWHVTREWPSRS